MNDQPIKTIDQMEFEAWEREVDAYLTQVFGVCLADLPDEPTRDWYDAGIKPAMAAARVIRHNRL